MMKLQKQFFISANDKGQLFFFEILFVMLILLIFVFAYAHIKIESNAQDLLMNFKTSDVITIITAKQIIIVEEIKKVIEFYLPNSKYTISINDIEKYSTITTEKECMAKETIIYDANLGVLKTTTVKIVVCS